MSSILSASSITIISTYLNVRKPLFSKSSSLPGVATKMSTFLNSNSFNCLLKSVPPYKTRVLNFEKIFSCFESFPI